MKDDRSYITDEDIEALNLERLVHPTEKPEQLTQRVFDDNAGGAAMQIVNLARRAGSEGVRLKAACYVVDRVLGKVGDAKIPEDGKKDLFEELFESVVRTADEQETKAIDAARVRYGLPPKS